MKKKNPCVGVPRFVDFPDGKRYVTGYRCSCCGELMTYIRSDRHWEDTATYHDYECKSCGTQATHFVSDFTEY